MVRTNNAKCLKNRFRFLVPCLALYLITLFLFQVSLFLLRAQSQNENLNHIQFILSFASPIQLICHQILIYYIYHYPLKYIILRTFRTVSHFILQSLWDNSWSQTRKIKVKVTQRINKKQGPECQPTCFQDGVKYYVILYSRDSIRTILFHLSMLLHSFFHFKIISLSLVLFL